MNLLSQIELKTKNGKGKCIYAKRNFNAGDFVLIFQGDELKNIMGRHTLQIGSHEHLLIYEPQRYVNHSCNPNCGIKGRTILVAMRSIKKGEEITFDYAMTEERCFGWQCLCGSKNCRGKIAGFKGLPEDFKKKYTGFISDYLLQKPANR